MLEGDGAVPAGFFRCPAPGAQIAEAFWIHSPPRMWVARQLDAPLFVGLPGIRSLARLAMRRALGRPVRSMRGLAATRSPRELASFLIWLDSARFFGVRRVKTLEGDPHPLGFLAASARSEPAAHDGDGRICAVVIAQNEEQRIGAALASVAPFVEQIVVVDGGSADGTRDVARSLGATVVERPWTDDFAAQRNAGLDAVRVPWVLALDCDEVIDDALGSIYAAAARTARADAVFSPRLNIATDVAGWVGYNWPDYQLRLFRSTCRYAGAIHESIVGWSRPIVTPANGPFIEHRKPHGGQVHRVAYYAMLELKKALGAHAGAVERFEALPDGDRDAYVSWVGRSEDPEAWATRVRDAAAMFLRGERP